MRRKNLAGLVVFNVALLLVLAVMCLTPQPTQAQGLRGGDYIMISGRVQGQDTGVLYITELRDAQMITVTYNRQQRRLVVLGGRDIRRDVR